MGFTGMRTDGRGMRASGFPVRAASTSSKIVLHVLPWQMPMPQRVAWVMEHLEIDDAEFARRLYAECNVTVLPGVFWNRNV